VTPNVDSGGVVQEPVKDSRRKHLVGKDLAPLPIGFVTGQNDTALEITPANQLEEKLCRQSS
jgi:hypothetical protein